MSSASTFYALAAVSVEVSLEVLKTGADSVPFGQFIRKAVELFQEQADALESTDKLVDVVVTAVTEFSEVVTILEKADFDVTVISFQNVTCIIEELLKDVIKWKDFSELKRKFGFSRSERTFLAQKYGTKFQGGLEKLSQSRQNMLLAISASDLNETKKLQNAVRELDSTSQMRMAEILEELRKYQQSIPDDVEAQLEAAGVDSSEDLVDIRVLLAGTHDLAEDNNRMLRDLHKSGLSFQVQRRHNLKMTTKIIGREDTLANIQRHLGSPGRMVCISGIAGVGKSTCAEAAAKAFLAEDLGRRFAWSLPAESEAVLTQGYLEAVSALNATIELKGNYSTQDIAQRLVDVLAATELQWLLIFDNVPDDGPDRFKNWFFPSTRGLGVGRILFTTRSAKFTGDMLCDGADIHLEKLEPLSVDDGAAVLLMNHQETEEREDQASTELSRMLGGLPLALFIVRKVSRARYGSDGPLRRYLDDYNRETGDRAEEALENEIRQTLKQPFLLITEQDGKDSAAHLLLSALPCFSPDRLPRSLLVSCANGDDAALRRLVDVGILQKTEGGSDAVDGYYYSVHRLLHGCVREVVEPVIERALEKMATEMSAYIDSNSGTWKAMKELVVHGAHLYQVAMDSRAFLQSTDKPKTLCLRVLNPMSSYLRHFDHQMALHWGEKALSVLENVYGPNAKNADIATTLHSLANVKYAKKDLLGAKQLYEKALDMKLSVYGALAKIPDVASTLSNLALVKKELHDFDGALQLYKKVLNMLRPTEKRAIATALNNLGQVKHAMKDFNGAQQLYEKALKMKRSVYGARANNTDIAGTLNNLATVKFDRQDLDGAQKLLEEALDIQRCVFGDETNNAEMAATLNNLAAVKQAREDYAGASKLFKEALDMRRLVYGVDAKNPEIAKTLHNLALVKRALEDFAGALELYEEALNMKHCVYGASAKNTDIADTLCGLAIVKRALGDFAGALELFEEALDMKHSVYGANAKNIDIAQTMLGLADVRIAMGDLKSAKLLLEHVLKMSLGDQGSSSSWTAIAQCCHVALVKVAVRDFFRRVIRPGLGLCVCILLIAGLYYLLRRSQQEPERQFLSDRHVEMDSASLSAMHYLAGTMADLLDFGAALASLEQSAQEQLSACIVE
eukprot:scaffold1135_cov216-Pinguiococcus_pyrenoidosus.AAC.11